MSRTIYIAASVRLVFSMHCASAQQAPYRATTAEAESLELHSQAVAEYRLYLKHDPAKTELIREAMPVLRWTNPLRETPTGAAFLWTEKGRPHAVACIYTYGEASIDHEFQSLTVEPLQGRRN